MQKSFPTYLKTIYWMIVGTLTLVGSVISTFASIGLNVLSILALPALFRKNALNQIKQEPAILMFTLAFLLLSLSMILRNPLRSEAIYIVNFLPLLLAAPVYVLSRSMSGEKLALIIAKLCFFSLIISVGVGYFDVSIRQFSRAEGFFTGSLVYARLSIMLGFSAATGLFLVAGWKKALFILGPVLGIIASILAGARGVILAAPFLFIWLFIVLAMDKTLKGKGWVFGGVFVLASIGVGIAIVSPAGPRIVSTFSTISSVINGEGAIGGNTQQRLVFLESGWRYFLDNPLFGYGWNQLDELSTAALIASGIADIPRLAQFHNDLINFSVAFGLVGVLAWIILLAAPIVGALKGPRDKLFLARLYASGVLSILYFVSGATDITFGYDMPTTAYTFFAAIILGGMREKPDVESP